MAEWECACLLTGSVCLLFHLPTVTQITRSFAHAYNGYRSAIAQRESRTSKPIKRRNELNVVYNTDGRGARLVKDPKKRWKFEPAYPVTVS